MPGLYISIRTLILSFGDLFILNINLIKVTMKKHYHLEESYDGNMTTNKNETTLVQLDVTPYQGH